MSATDRIPCCVPFCRRTGARIRFPDAEEIICGKHGNKAEGGTANWVWLVFDLTAPRTATTFHWLSAPK
jgi:hypothetical protein